MTAGAGTTYCARHPDTETGLRCGRCETPICPRCVVMTDVGARCPDCAPSRKLPQFEIAPLYLLRGTLAALIAGAVVGALWGALLPDISGFFEALLGLGAGYAIGESTSLATNRKAGPPLQIVAAAGVLLAFLLRNVVASDDIIPRNEIFWYVALIAALAVAVNRLRA